MKKTKIDWADSTWNPVTGCLHGCEYCYARGIATRFSRRDAYCLKDTSVPGEHRALHVLDERMEYDDGRNAPYPFGFAPTFHRYKLNEPAKWTKSRTIFVCSMADLFGDWVPDEWIGDVFDACCEAPQHRYMFLTKAPARYIGYEDRHPLMVPDRDNFWYGTSITSERDSDRIYDLLNWHNYNGANTFVSVEPLHDRLWQNARQHIAETQWAIIGAETGRRKERVTPEREWVDHIVNMCIQYNTPVFMKDSLRDLMGDDFRQEFPWEVASDD